MKWYQKLYISDNIHISKERLQKRIEKGWLPGKIYLIVLSGLPEEQFEIIPLKTLKLPFFEKETYRVIGVARGYYHARSLVEDIVSDVYRATGDCRCKAFFQEQMAESREG